MGDDTRAPGSLPSTAEAAAADGAGEKIVGRGIRSYVLRAGRMSDAQRRSLDTLWPRYGVPPGEGLLEWEKIFGRKDPPIVEIGFGMGQTTAAIAQERPGTSFLGIEVHRPGIGRLLWEIDRRGLANLRLIEGDAVEILEKRVAPDSVAGFHIFFPDPWPKKRHHKRRLVTRPFTDLLASRLAPGGYLAMVTDWADYAAWALAELSATPGLVNPYDGFAPPQTWRPATKFETRGRLASREIRELFFTKAPA